MKRIYTFIFALFLINIANAQWIAQNSGTTKNLNSVCFPTANIGYAVGASGTILKTADAGTHWIALKVGATDNINSVSFPTPDTGCFVTQGGYFFSTTDGGATWWQQFSVGSYTLNSVFSLLNTKSSPVVQVGFTVGQAGIIYFFEGHGTGILGSGTSNALNSVFKTNFNTGYAVGALGTIIETINGGADWTTLTSGTTIDLYSVYFSNANTGYAVGGNNAFGSLVKQHQVIIKTTDGGKTWSTLSSGTSTPLYSVYFTDENTGYDVGGTASNGFSQSQTILKTTDGGNNWTSLPGVNNNYLTSVVFPNANTGYAVGVNGTILKTTNGGIATSVKENILQKISFTIYPNPASEKVTIANNNNASTENTVSIFNIAGQQIMSQKYFNQDKIELNVSQFLKGVYILKIQAGNENVNKQLVIQ